MIDRYSPPDAATRESVFSQCAEEIRGRVGDDDRGDRMAAMARVVEQVVVRRLATNLGVLHPRDRDECARLKVAAVTARRGLAFTIAWSLPRPLGGRPMEDPSAEPAADDQPVRILPSEAPLEMSVQSLGRSDRWRSVPRPTWRTSK